MDEEVQEWTAQVRRFFERLGELLRVSPERAERLTRDVGNGDIDAAMRIYQDGQALGARVVDPGSGRLDLHFDPFAVDDQPCNLPWVDSTGIAAPLCVESLVTHDVEIGALTIPAGRRYIFPEGIDGEAIVPADLMLAESSGLVIVTRRNDLTRETLRELGMWHIENLSDRPIQVGSRMVDAGASMVVHRSRIHDRHLYDSVSSLIIAGHVRMTRIVTEEEIAATAASATPGYGLADTSPNHWRNNGNMRSGPPVHQRVQALEEQVATLQDTIETLTGMDALAVQELLRELKRRR